MVISNSNNGDNKIIHVLWISPNFNHYKARLLNQLAKYRNIELTVLAGVELSKEGHKNIDIEWSFKKYNINVSKSKFGYSNEVRKWLTHNHTSFEWIMIPREKKNLFLFLYLVYLRNRRLNTNNKLKLFSYNHPIATSNKGKSNRIDLFITRFFYRYYDKVIFYTQQGRDKMVKRNLIKANIAYWANNTIDTSEVDKHYTFKYPDFNNPTILFIGRLIQTKKVNILLDYYHYLKEVMMENGQSLKLLVIGDGPESIKIKEAQKKDDSIIWLGSIVEEKLIARYMSMSSFIFVPGHSGLSINHAFAYGRPYVTFDHIDHPPEIDYIETHKNGFVMNNDLLDNIELLTSFLLFPDKKFYDFAHSTGQSLSSRAWCDQILYALKN